MNYNDKYLLNIENKINELIKKNTIDFSNGLYNCMEQVYSNSTELIADNSTIDSEMIKVIILHKLYE